MKNHCNTKIVIIGSGMVGSSAAYASMIQGRATEIVLIDRDISRRDGEVMDLSHGSQYTETQHIRGGTYQDCRDADIIVFTAGAAQLPGETRIDLAAKNVKVLKNVLNELKAYLSPHTILLIISNPVDILTFVAQKVLKKHDPNKIIGSGTSLDSSRFRYYLGQYFGISPHSIHAYIIGEHGDSELPVWSTANIAGVGLKHFKGYNKQAMNKIYLKTKNAAYEIIKRKKATYYAIGLLISEISEMILSNQRAVIPLSVNPKGMYGIKDVCIGLPCVLCRSGIQSVIPLTLNASEKKMLQTSAKKLQGILKQIS